MMDSSVCDQSCISSFSISKLYSGETSVREDPPESEHVTEYSLVLGLVPKLVEHHEFNYSTDIAIYDIFHEHY